MKLHRSKRIDQISASWENLAGLESFGLVRAYCACLTPAQACYLLLQVADTTHILRAAALRKVSADIARSYGRHHNDLLLSLQRRFLKTDSRGRQGIGYCLSELSVNAPRKEHRAIQEFFLASEYIGVRRRGYKSIANDSIAPRKLLGKAWQQRRDQECAWLIVKGFPADFLILNRKALAAVLPHAWQLARLYLRIGEVEPELLQELRDADQISYCYVLAKLGLQMSRKEAIQIIDRCSGDERIGLLIWSFGQLGHWHALKYIEAQLPVINAKRLKTAMARYSGGSLPLPDQLTP